MIKSRFFRLDTDAQRLAYRLEADFRPGLDAAFIQDANLFQLVVSHKAAPGHFRIFWLYCFVAGLQKIEQTKMDGADFGLVVIDVAENSRLIKGGDVDLFINFAQQAGKNGILFIIRIDFVNVPADAPRPFAAQTTFIIMVARGALVGKDVVCVLVGYDCIRAGLL